MENNNLYSLRSKILSKILVSKGLIKPIEKEVFEKLDNFYLGGIPLSIRLKYLHLDSSMGDCFDRSLFLTFGLDNSLLVRGDLRPLELKYGKDRARHGWVEYDGWVYDPSHLCKYRKDIYYSLFSPDNISCIKYQVYQSGNDYQDVLETSLDDLKPDGKRRKTVEMSLYLVSNLAKILDTPDLTNELQDHFKKIKYDGLHIDSKCKIKKVG